MTNGPIDRSNAPQNPYPKGSALYKLWERREADRRAAELKKKKKKKKVTPKDDSNRRKSIDKYLDSTE